MKVTVELFNEGSIVYPHARSVIPFGYIGAAQPHELLVTEEIAYKGDFKLEKPLVVVWHHPWVNVKRYGREE